MYGCVSVCSSALCPPPILLFSNTMRFATAWRRLMKLSPRHFAQPGETKTETLEWPSARQPGEYLAAAGLRRSDGLDNSSAPIQFTVR